ncbi:MAG: peptidylprolyl isomerase [Bacteroidota bacterium]
MGIMSIRRMAHKFLAPVILVLVVAMLIGVFYIGIPNFGKESYGYKGPSLKVYGKKVKDADFNNYLMRVSQQASQFAQIKAYSEAELRDAAINTAIQTVAFEREMEQAGSKIKVSKAELDKVIKKYFPTEEELKSFMEQQGFTDKKEFQKTLTKELKYQKFVQNKARELKITVPKEEVLGYVEEIAVSHVLVSTKDGDKEIRSDAQALARANEVYQKLANNGDIAKLAKEYSDDPGSKDKGGSLGSMPIDYFKNSMVKEFVDASLALKPGEISKPVKSQFGYHVIKLESRKMPAGEEYKEKYREIEDQLLYQKAEYDPKYRQWLEGVFKKAEENMEILDPGLRAFRLMKDEKWKEAAEAYEKALNKKYYKNKVDTYVNATTVYVKLNQASKAIEILDKAPAEIKADLEFQIALGNAYRENKQPEKAKELLLEYGEGHMDNDVVHERLKTVFTDWKMTDAVEKEEKILADIKKAEEEELQKYQQDLEGRNQSK